MASAQQKIERGHIKNDRGDGGERVRDTGAPPPVHELQ